MSPDHQAQVYDHEPSESDPPAAPSLDPEPSESDPPPLELPPPVLKRQTNQVAKRITIHDPSKRKSKKSRHTPASPDSTIAMSNDVINRIIVELTTAQANLDVAIDELRSLKKSPH